MEVNKIYQGNNIETLKTFEDNSIDSIVTDPPYGLGKEPDALEVLQSWITDGYHEIKGKGFMGKEWDAFVPQPNFWRECLRVLKPGGHLLSFAGTRTYDWMVMGLRIAGFEIRDQIAWVYGSGFPKSHDISKAIDKRGGNNIGWFGTWLREWREKNNIKQSDISKLFPSKTGGLTGCVANWELGLNIPTAEQYSKIVEHFNLPFKTIEEAEREVIGKYDTDMGGLGGERLGNKGGDITTPSTDEAKQWQGWGTALKPALEPIVMARKPLDGTVANNVLKHGVGGINIDGCRVGDEVIPEQVSGKNSKAFNLTEEQQKSGTGIVAGYRSPEQIGRFPANFIHDGSEEVVKLFPSSDSGNGTPYNYSGKEYNNKDTSMFNGDKPQAPSNYNDSGSASRFFYTAKASQTERNWGLGGFEDAKGGSYQFRQDGSLDGKIPTRKNIHPTVKPIDLMRYLVRLVTPKGGICLDPFMGSGTTAVACKMEGFNYVGCELMEEYVKIAEARIDGVVVYDSSIDTKVAIQESQHEKKEKELGIMNIFDFLDGDK